MTVQKPSDYLHNLEKRKQTLYRITPDGREMYVLNNVQFEIEEFNKYFPLGDKIRVLSPAQMKGYDLDSTHI